MAGTGPIPMISGGTPTVEYATNLANGFNPFALTASSDASNTDAAPSQIPYESNDFFVVVDFFVTFCVCIENSGRVSKNAKLKSCTENILCVATYRCVSSCYNTIFLEHGL